MKPTKQAEIERLTQRVNELIDIREREKDLLANARNEATRLRECAKELEQQVVWHRQMQRLLADKIPNSVR